MYSLKIVKQRFHIENDKWVLLISILTFDFSAKEYKSGVGPDCLKDTAWQSIRTQWNGSIGNIKLTDSKRES